MTKRLARTTDRDEIPGAGPRVRSVDPENMDRLAVLFRVVRATGVLETTSSARSRC